MESLHMDLVALFQWLLKTTLQGSLLIGLILAIKLLLREKLSPRWQYSLWLVLLLRLALPWAPQSRLSIYNVIPRSLPSGLVSRGPAQDVQVDEAGTKVHSPGRQGAPGSTLVAARDEASRSGADQAAASERSTTTTRANDGRSAAGRRSFTESATALAPWLWLGGCLVLGGYVLCRAFGLWRAVTSERPVTDQEILELLEDCKMQMRIRTIVGVVVTDRTRTPALFGFVRPRILLPQGLIEAFSLDDLHHVFLHELAHLKRRDIYLAWLVCLLGVLHWFNPLMWWAFRRMRADQEMAADALALSTAGVAESRRYGQTIVDLLERFSRPQYLPSLAGILESPSHIERRIAMIAQFSNNSYRWSLVGLTVITVLGTISMIDPTRGAAPASQPAPASPAVTMRAVEKDANAYSYVGVSPDGRYLCGLDTWRARGEIAIREVATGAERVIKPTKETSQESGPRCPVMSPDNKMIAYLVQRPGETDDDLQSADLRLIGVDGSGQRVLCRGAVSEGRVVQLAPKPIQWFPDGSRLLALGWPDRFHASESIEIVSVSIEDGTVQVIKKLTGSFSRARIRLSPDGNCVAYELPSRDAPEKHDIFALDLDAQQETLLVGHAAEDKLLDWTPDGRHILFSSDRLGPWSVWLLPVARGRAQGTPKLVLQSAGNISPIGFAQNGSYFYVAAAYAGDIYTAGINPTTGQLLSAPAALETGGYNSVADWSPDGKYLAYGSRPARAPGPSVIRIRTLATGAERELAQPPASFDCLRWSPDGRSLLVSGMKVYKPEDIAYTRRVYRMDAATGETTLLVENKVDDWWVQMAELSPDGKTLYYKQAGIVRRELDTGQEKTIFPFLSDCKGPWVSWALSPNGEFVATGVNEGTGEKGPEGAPEGGVKKVLLIPAQGGPAAELVRWDQEPANYLTHTGWSPDGKRVLFTLHRVPVAGENSPAMTEFWQVSIDGGQPRKIMETDLLMPPRIGFRVHPDGQRLAFSAVVGHGGLWVMENFLPPAALSETK